MAQQRRLDQLSDLVAVEVELSNMGEPILAAMFRRGWAYMLLHQLEMFREPAELGQFLNMLGFEPQERAEVIEIVEEGGSFFDEYWERWQLIVERSLRTKGYAFLCHASEDKPAVRALQVRLHEYGFRTWLDEDNILPGEDWDASVRSGLKKSEVVLILLSAVCVGKRGYVQREMQVALDILAEIPDGQIFIIPVVLDDCQIPERLARYQAVWLRRAEAFEKLVASLNYRMRGIVGMQP